MKIILKTLALLFMVPMFSNAQGQNELSVSLNNGVLFNKAGLEVQQGGNAITNVKNTFTQSLTFNYTRITKSGFLYTGGLGAGYEIYSAQAEYPFTDFGFKIPQPASDTYQFKATIPNFQVNVGIGYRLKGKWQPEVRIIERLMMPVKHAPLIREAWEEGFTGQPSQTFYMYGAYGKGSSGMKGVLLTAFAIGGRVPGNMGLLSGLDLGLMVQTNLFVKSYTSNFRAYYRDYSSTVRSIEEFRGTHTSLTLTLGYSF